MTLVTQSEFARHIGKSRQRVSQLKDAGKLVVVGSKIDLERSLALVQATTDPQKALAYQLSRDEDFVDPLLVPTRDQGPPAGGTGGIASLPPAGDPAVVDEYRLAAIEEKKLRADLIRLERDERAKILVPVEDVENERYEHGRAVRDAFLALPLETADTLAGMTDPAVIRAYLQKWAERQIRGLLDHVRTIDASAGADGGA